MTRRLVALFFIVPIVTVGPAIAGERDPACRQATVVDEMTRQIAGRDYYGRVDPKLVTETPTAVANVVRCQVCVQFSPYDMTRFGNRPIRRCLEHEFEVRILQRGFVVRDLN